MNALRWRLVKLRYRRLGIDLDGHHEDEIWHFAYGSNINPEVFEGRRRMRPRESRIARLPGYRLRFNLDGWPRGRSAPANISPDPDAEVWGVLYRMTRRDLVRLDSTEGVPRRRGYRHLWTEVEDRDGGRFTAVTYIAQGKEHDGNPSLRYITLIRDGARAQGLPAHHIEFLDSVRHAQ